MALPAKKSDSQIKHDVIEELRWDTRVKETDVGVEVRDGIVMLSGIVDTWASKLAAQDAAHRVVGVLDVANEIAVKVPNSTVRDDTDIAKAVRQALEWDVFVPNEQIHSTVSNGTVTLEGTVNYWTQYDDAARCVRNLAGVREVKNLIQIEPLPHLAAPTVRAAIEKALERRAEHASKGIRVSVINGDVVLSGAVPSWADLGVVTNAVRATPGVLKVDNQLRVHA